MVAALMVAEQCVLQVVLEDVKEVAVEPALIAAKILVRVLVKAVAVEAVQVCPAIRILRHTNEGSCNL